MAKLINVVSLSIAACFALSATSCSLAFNLGEDQCDKDADCQARGAGFAQSTCDTQHKVCIAKSGTGSTSASSSSGTGGGLPDNWKCIGNFKYPPQTGATFDQKLVFVDALSQMPVYKLKVKLCGPLDSTCQSPMAEMSPDMTGNLTIAVPTMPNGFYLDVTDASSTSSTTSSSSSSSSTGGGVAMCCNAAGMCKPEPGPPMEYRESLVYLGSSAGGPTILPANLKTIRLITNDGLCQLANIVKKTEDTTHGIAVVLTPDCNDTRQAGVLVETHDVDAETQELYFKNSVPNDMASQTDGEGAVGWFNLPAPSSVTFTTRLLTPACSASQMSCPQIGTATVYIRPACLTYVHVGPSP